MNKSYYAIIPAKVRYDKDLCPNAKLLYGELTALTNEKGFCWASNEYFAELYSVSTRSISKWIKQLLEKGYVFGIYTYRGAQVKDRYIYIDYTLFAADKRKLSGKKFTVKENFASRYFSEEEKFPGEKNTKEQKFPGLLEQKFLGTEEQKFQENNTVNTTYNNTGHKELNKTIKEQEKEICPPHAKHEEEFDLEFEGGEIPKTPFDLNFKTSENKIELNFKYHKQKTYLDEKDFKIFVDQKPFWEFTDFITNNFIPDLVKNEVIETVKILE